MNMTPDILGTARRIFQEHRTRSPFRPLAIAEQAGGEAFAYAVQDGYVEMLLGEGSEGPVAGHKIGLTTPRMQQMCGIGEPVTGAILAARIRASGTTLDRADFVRLGIECEIAVRIATTPDPAGIDTDLFDLIRDHVDHIAAAFEIIEDRDADYKTLDAFSLIADNSWNAGIVLGTPVASDALASLQGRKGVLRVDGVETARGSSDDVLGDPGNALAWLVRHLAARGRRLKPGDWVMTGSIVPTQFVAPGRHVFTVDGMPPVEIDIR